MLSLQKFASLEPETDPCYHFRYLRCGYAWPLTRPDTPADRSPHLPQKTCPTPPPFLETASCTTIAGSLCCPAIYRKKSNSCSIAAFPRWNGMENTAPCGSNASVLTQIKPDGQITLAHRFAASLATAVASPTPQCPTKSTTKTERCHHITIMVEANEVTLGWGLPSMRLLKTRLGAHLKARKGQEKPRTHRLHSLRIVL
jgi:hypothetical protein